MPRMFGTDGVRGLANRDLTAQLALDLGDAAVRVLGSDSTRTEQPTGRRRALIGREPAFRAISSPTRSPQA